MASAFDGNFSIPGGFEVGAPDIEFPFEVNGDYDAIIVTRSYWQTRAQWIADRLSGGFRAGVMTDPEYPDAYLMATSKPSKLRTGLYAFTRTFARVPATQTAPGSLFIAPPSPADSGGYVAHEFSGGAPTIDYGEGYILSSSFFAPTGKIYTPLNVCTSADSGGNTRLTFSSAHGIAGTEEIVYQFLNGTGTGGVLIYTFYPVAAGAYSVINSTTIDILGQTNGTGIVGCAKYSRDYSFGQPKQIVTSLETKFYLPGVSAGIATASDIPLPTYQGNSGALMSAILAGATSINYQVGDLARWKDWPILAQTTTKINPANL